ncbi:tigger transposable element-derived protein [Plakobranchus ocellatus]|uniref:Tigger transposable element-derived protein n=1 Tax=Plakobranchus ocellatus TaxID=259542 RepID=A0AAV4AMC7_9GAST|nr:tigger transposable element-derived protein [Plakobranchus ocellatus]
MPGSKKRTYVRAGSSRRVRNPPTYITRLLPAVGNCSQLCYYVTAIMYAYFSPWPAVPDLIAPFSTSLLEGDDIALGLILFCTYGSEWKKLVLNIRQEDFVRLGAAQTDRQRGMEESITGVQATKSPSVQGMCGRGCNDCNTTLLRRPARVTPARPGAVNTSSDQGAWILFEQSSQDGKENRCTYRVRKIIQEKNKNVQQQSRRLAIKVANLSEIVHDLKNKNYVSDSCAELLEQSFSGVPLQLMKRILQKKGQGSFHPSLKTFAITLQFHSTKAYNFVRDTFGLGLPAVGTLRGWFRSVDGNVGFNASVMQSLESKVKEARKQGNEVLCSLMLDEMAIMKKIEFDGKKTFGFVDIGSGVTDDGAPAATQALVFMVVCVNGSWKVPIGFFFIHGMTGKEKASLVREYLHQLGQIGIKVISLTCDGPSCHFAMLIDLGASMDPENLDPSFPHPDIKSLSSLMYVTR